MIRIYEVYIAAASGKPYGKAVWESVSKLTHKIT